MSASRTAVHQPWPGLIQAYRDRLPVGDDWTPVTLLEGGTPLIAAGRISVTPVSLHWTDLPRLDELPDEPFRHAFDACVGSAPA